jgi:hypothetical protein
LDGGTGATGAAEVSAVLYVILGGFLALAVAWLASEWAASRREGRGEGRLPVAPVQWKVKRRERDADGRGSGSR